MKIVHKPYKRSIGRKCREDEVRSGEIYKDPRFPRSIFKRIGTGVYCKTPSDKEIWEPTISDYFISNYRKIDRQFVVEVIGREDNS